MKEGNAVEEAVSSERKISSIMDEAFACTPKPKLHYVSTYAGTAQSGSRDGQRQVASFNYIKGLAIDKYGNLIVADALNHKIRKINTSGFVTTVAGNGTEGSMDGPVSIATFYQPEGVTVDRYGNIYVSDQGNKIRKISTTGHVTTYAGSGNYGSNDGPAKQASFKYAGDMAFDAEGNLFIADVQGYKIRKVSPEGMVSTFAGTGEPGAKDGPANKATFLEPLGIAVDQAGNVYVSDGNHKIRKITRKGLVSTYAGTGKPFSADGSAHRASFYLPGSLALDEYGNLYVSEGGAYKVRKVSPEGFVFTIAGSGERGDKDGAGNKANFDGPTGIAFDRFGNIFVGDGFNNKVKLVSPKRPANEREILTSITN
ncbi:NHL repeat-containing protein [Desertivirga arenae]|uniref:NHL repeat-containing protein n=1 Tax=Desertivirga arenae TaxID=2810309 RepID=UPI001A96A7E9|nr:NHL repeat-containing protein [Pedobacter sp. SYSU D00823]